MSLELAVVMPVYNEEEIIQTVVKDWDKTLSALKIDYVIAVYNDGSKDKTLSKLQEMKLARLKVVDKKNSGHGPTIVQAYRDYNSALWMFQLDSDNELRTEEFPKLWAERNNYDLLLGNRYNRDSPLARRIMTFISYLTLRLFYGKGVLDTNVPYRLIRTEKIRPYLHNLDGLFAPNIVISGIAGLKKWRIFQMPVKFYSRTTGEVSIQKWKLLKVAYKSFAQTIKVRFLL
ncbi:MAG: glycosyltransferase family 2 protein [Bacteriovoracaceae bacterium]